MLTIIEYVNSNSIIHKLDPRSKIIYSVCILGSAIITHSIPFLLLTILISLIIWKLANIPIRSFKTVIVMIILIILVGVISQSIFYTNNPGYEGTKTTIFNLMPFYVPNIGYLPVTLEGFEYGIMFSMRMITIFLSAIVLPLTTHPSEIILMLRKFKFPEWIILLFTMTIRFLPLTIQNLTITRNAQKIRKDKISFNDLLLLLESIIISSLRTAKQIALNLDVKSFGYTKRRTSLKSINFKKNDLIFLVFSLFIFILSIVSSYKI